MATYEERTQVLLDARTDADVFAVAKTPIEAAPIVGPDPTLPDATLGIIINKLRHGRGDKWIKHNVTNPDGEHPSITQIQAVRELWTAEVVERTPEP